MVLASARIFSWIFLGLSAGGLPVRGDKLTPPFVYTFIINECTQKVKQNMKKPPKNWRQKVRERGLTTGEDTWYKRQEELVPAANGNGQSPKFKNLRNCRFSLWSGSGYFFARIIRPRETAAITSISNAMTSLMLIGWPPFLWETGPNTSCLRRIYHSFCGISTGECAAPDGAAFSFTNSFTK